MLKDSLVAIVFALALFPFTVAPAQADDHEWAAGDAITTSAYCNSPDEKWPRELSDVVTREGIDGYAGWIDSSGNPCFDARRHINANPVRGVLLERVWTLKTSDGENVEMWRFMDGARQVGFTWLQPKAEVMGEDA